MAARHGRSSPPPTTVRCPTTAPQQDGGFLPNVSVSPISALVQGNIDPTTGRATPQQGDPNILLATTFGRGQFAIRLAPIVFPNTVQLDTKLPAPNGSISGKDAQGNPIVKVTQPVFDGLSEQTAFGNIVYITLVDMTDPSNPRIIGGYDPSNPATSDRGQSKPMSSGKLLGPDQFGRVLDERDQDHRNLCHRPVGDLGGHAGDHDRSPDDQPGAPPAADDPDSGAQPVRRLIQHVPPPGAGPERHQHQPRCI